MPTRFDVIVLGAGAAGLMCAIEAAKRGKSVLVLEKANKPGKKILMSGGGHCNFTNLNIQPNRYLSHNAHFVKSALSRYTQWGFIELVKKYRIQYYEKKDGQLFCVEKAKVIVNMLLQELAQAGGKLYLQTTIESVAQSDCGYKIKTQADTYECASLVVACGGLSIPSLGSSPLGYKIAEQFGLKVWPLTAGLVPFTLHNHDKEKFASIAGVSNHSTMQANGVTFEESLLFTHRGLSGPVALQVSSYWSPGQSVQIDLLPGKRIEDILLKAKSTEPLVSLKNFLSKYFAKSLIEVMFDDDIKQKKIKSLQKNDMDKLVQKIHHFSIVPNGTEGYRTAEVTLGGVDCNAISSKTMQANNIPGLYFIGEVLDVAGWLGGYNFQWAWSSGWAAGQVV